jgi:hypothetical protein
VYVGYQNSTAKDGTDNKTSTIVQYTRRGQVIHIFTVLGHCDGLRFNPSTHLLWATSNEDGNPRIVTINPDTGVITPYVFPFPTPHGGGYDDVIFVGDKAFIAASNPTRSRSTRSGGLFLDSQADGDLIFVYGPGSGHQTSLRLHLTNGTSKQITVDDTVFATLPRCTILVVDTV